MLMNFFFFFSVHNSAFFQVKRQILRDISHIVIKNPSYCFSVNRSIVLLTRRAAIIIIQHCVFSQASWNQNGDHNQEEVKFTLKIICNRIPEFWIHSKLYNLFFKLFLSGLRLPLHVDYEKFFKIDFLGPLTDRTDSKAQEGKTGKQGCQSKTSSSTMNQEGDNQTSESLSQRLQDGSMPQFFTVDRI